MALAWYHSPTDWDRLCGDAPFELSWAYGAAAEAQGARVWRVGLGNADDPDAMAQVVSRGAGSWRLALLPRGVFCRRPTGGDAMARIHRALPGRVCMLHAGEGGRQVAAGRSVARVDLQGDPRARMSKSWRNALTRAQRQNLCVFIESGCPDWLIRADADLRRSRGVRGLPGRWIRSLRRVSPGCLETLVAYRDGVPLAGMCFAKHGSVATYLLGWNGQVGRQLGAHQLLLDRAATRMHQRGFTGVDLGIVDARKLPGLTRFKLGAGGAPVAIPPTRILWAA